MHIPVFSEAVQEFWHIRSQQLTEQQQRGMSDQGARGAATGGKQMQGFIRTIHHVLLDVGIAPASIFTQQVELPGYYRPNKKWDIVVVTDGQLRVAIELKSQIGPSFGNNFNNRTEEAMGSALDMRTAIREGALNESSTPWLGYLFLLEDCPQSRSPVKTHAPHFPVLPEFRDASYAQRYELFCLRLVQQRQYNVACLLLSDKQQSDSLQNYKEPHAMLAGDRFLDELVQHVQKG